MGRETLRLVEDLREREKGKQLGAMTARLQEHGMSPEDIEASVHSPVEIEEMAKSYMRTGGVAEQIVDHHRLAETLDRTEHLPYYSKTTVEKNDLPLETSLSGRILDITVSRKQSGLAETMSLVDPEWADGEITRQLLSAEREEVGEYDPFDGMKSAFAVYRLDRSAAHPLAGVDSRYAHSGDYKLVDVISSCDANPVMSYVQMRHTEIDDDSRTGRPRIVGHTESFGELSEYADKRGFEGIIRRELGDNPATYNRVIDMFIAKFGRGWNESGSNDGLQIPDSDPKYNSHVINLLRDFRNQSDSPFSWRVPLRAYHEYRLIAKHLDEGGKKQEAEKRKDNIRREVVQALGMANEAHLLGLDAVMFARARKEAPINPIRWTMQGIDGFDRTIARGLQTIPDNPAAHADSQRYANLEPSIQLVIAASRGNNLQIELSKDGRSGGIGPEYAYKSGASAAFDGSGGTFPPEIFASIYDADIDDFKMKGIAAVVSAHLGKNIPLGETYMVVDLLQAPGKLLEDIVEMGYFTNKRSALPQQPYLSEQLLRRRARPRLVLAVTDEIFKNISVHTLIEDNSSVEIVMRSEIVMAQEDAANPDSRNKPASAIEVHPRDLEPVIEEKTERRRRGIGSAALSRRGGQKDFETVVPIRKPHQTDAQPGEKTIAGIGFYNGAVHVHRPSTSTPSRIVTMRSEPRPPKIQPEHQRRQPI